MDDETESQINEIVHYAMECVVEGYHNGPRINSGEFLSDVATNLGEEIEKIITEHTVEDLAAIRAMLPPELARLGAIGAVRKLLETYQASSRNHIEAVETIERLRTDRIASVLPIRVNDIAIDNDDAVDGW